MTPLPHHYSIQITGGPTQYATARDGGLHTITCATPANFGGPGDAWGPEHLLLASVASCFLFTFQVVARGSKLEYAALFVDVAGTVDRVGSQLQFVDIEARPRLTLTSSTDSARALRALEKAAGGCLVSASLRVPVRVQPMLIGPLGDDEQLETWRAIAGH